MKIKNKPKVDANVSEQQKKLKQLGGKINLSFTMYIAMTPNNFFFFLVSNSLLSLNKGPEVKDKCRKQKKMEKKILKIPFRFK